MTKGPAPSNGIKVAIVGSGPAGITIAILMARMGYQVTMFESKDKIGGILRYGIPEFRLPKSVLDDIQYRHLEMKGIKIRPNTRKRKSRKSICRESVHRKRAEDWYSIHPTQLERRT